MMLYTRTLSDGIRFNMVSGLDAELVSGASCSCLGSWQCVFSYSRHHLRPTIASTDSSVCYCTDTISRGTSASPQIRSLLPSTNHTEGCSIDVHDFSWWRSQRSAMSPWIVLCPTSGKDFEVQTTPKVMLPFSKLKSILTITMGFMS